MRHDDAPARHKSVRHCDAVLSVNRAERKVRKGELEALSTLLYPLETEFFRGSASACAQVCSFTLAVKGRRRAMEAVSG